MTQTKLLFTPGPLSTSPGVKQAMLRDLGSRDAEFIGVVREIRRRLVELGGAPDYEAIPVQGSGTYAVEAMLGCAVPPQGRLMIAVNGAYGKRMVQIAQRLKIGHTAIEFEESAPVDVEKIEAALSGQGPFTQLACVHCETTTGLLNPVEELGEVCAKANVGFLVDAMSSFGGVPLDLERARIGFLVSSSNKCIQGVPGFGFALAQRQTLEASQGNARSLSLDLFSQWRGLDSDGQFRFTPPVQILLAFHQALVELEEEGGIAARHRRYSDNHRTLLTGMRALGFKEYLAERYQGPIITSFLYPCHHPAFGFERLYARLSEKGFVIYPGKLSRAEAFRIGTIGHIWPADVQALVSAVGEVLGEMGMAVPLEGRR